jgi:hypothetical protein
VTERRGLRLTGCLFNPHTLFLSHLAAFILGGSFIWSLNASDSEKRFDTLVWLALLSLHGLILYRARRVAFGYHLLLFSAGAAAIWSVDEAALLLKIGFTLGWLLLMGLVGAALLWKRL